MGIAERFGGEIVNYDSLQVYRHFDIGSAKVTAAERRGVPHHLLDIIDPGQVFSAGEFARRAREALVDVAGRGRLPVLVGGTGFYLHALTEGLAPAPAGDPELRARLLRREETRPASLHRILSRLDPNAARRIHQNDRQKTLRALELRLLRARPVAELYAQGREALTGFRVIKIGLQPDRDLLYRRIDLRLQRMFDEGLVDEVRRILALGVPSNAKPFESLGYKEALAYVEGRMSLADAIASAQLETRHYAKRQLTWFRREAGMMWFAGFGHDPEIQQQVFDYLPVALASSGNF